MTAHPADVIAQHPTVLETALAIADATHRDRYGPENAIRPWYLGDVADHVYPTCPALRRSLPAGKQPRAGIGHLYPEAGDVCGWCLRVWRARKAKENRMRPSFTRGFRLHHNGRYLDGAEFPSGRICLLDDPEYGFATVASSMEELRKGYHGARVEWPGDQLVPTWLIEELARIVAEVAGTPTAAADAPALSEAARAVLGRGTAYLGYDVAERAAEAADAVGDGSNYPLDPDAEAAEGEGGDHSADA